MPSLRFSASTLACDDFSKSSQVSTSSGATLPTPMPRTLLPAGDRALFLAPNQPQVLSWPGAKTCGHFVGGQVHVEAAVDVDGDLVGVRSTHQDQG